MTCDLCVMYMVAWTERLTAAMQRLQGLGSSACTSARHGAPSFACDRLIAIGTRQLYHGNLSVTAPSKSAARSARSRGHFCDVLASECPCRAAGDFQPAPIQRLEALCTARRGTGCSLLCFMVRAAANCSRRVDAAYLQPCGFRFQLSRFLPAEHQRLLRRLVTWQLL